MISVHNSRSVIAVLVAIGVVVVYVSRGWVDSEAIEAAARQPDHRIPVETRGFRFPAPDAYPLPISPQIKSREDLIAYYTRGEDPDLVRRYSEGPEEELIAYLGEVFARAGYPYQGESSSPGENDPGGDLAMGSVAAPRKARTLKDKG